MNTTYKRRLLKSRRRRRGGMPFWMIGLLALGALGSLAIVAGVGATYAVYREYADEYVPIDQKLAQDYAGLTEIYDRAGPENGEHLGTLTNPAAALLDPVELNEISPWLIEATISTEDNSFWSNPGVNPRGLLRAAWENYLGGGIGTGSGGSSITQQLIKNVYLSDDCEVVDGREYCIAPRTLDRKVREIAFAFELENDYSKEQILTWYLNQISYADRYVGIEAAAQGYFRKSASELTLAEAALLAGVPQFPGAYHPRLNCIRDFGGNCILDEEGRMTVGGDAKERQEAVLDLMVDHGRATREEVEAAKTEVLLVYPAVSDIQASAWIDNQVEPRLVRMCQAGMLPLLEGASDCVESVHSAGYKVTTTLDWTATQMAQQMVADRIFTGAAVNGCNCFNAAVTTIDPASGQVVVYVPNSDYQNIYDERVQGDIDQAVEINQPGSSFKPAVYLAWMDVLGKAPMSTFWDSSPLDIEGTQIVNPRSGGGSEGLISARLALGGSQNVPAVRAAAEAGIDNVILTAQRLGITTLAQGFDPTFVSHPTVYYGASIATGGANIRNFDMAYMNATIANMGVMVGVPTLATYLPVSEFRGTYDNGVPAEGAAYDIAIQQKFAFQQGHIRVEGTRPLDPVTILRVEEADGTILYDHLSDGDLQRVEMINPGSVWLLHSIMSDCNARVIIWGCGSSNDDLSLNTFMSSTGERIPGGVKTGTQQGFVSANDTLETWTNGYSRYAATSVWVGNSNNELVRDGTAGNFAAANTTVRLYKNWMGAYHAYLQSLGAFTTPAGFDELQPPNVKLDPEFKSPTTDRNAGGTGGRFCDQKVSSWIRTDIEYEDPCEEAEIDTRNGLLAGSETPAQYRALRKFVKLPAFQAAPARALAGRFGIPIVPTEVSTGQPLIGIYSPSASAKVSGVVTVTGYVRTTQIGSWTLDFGAGSTVSSWTTIGSGTETIDGTLGTFDATALAPGVYTIRLTVSDSQLGEVSVRVVVNVTAPGAPPGEPEDDD